MSLNPPVKFSASLEALRDDEAATIAELNETFDVILDRTSEDYGHAVRAVHAKSHGVMQGELIVDAGLPPELAQGLFAAPATHRVYVRLSTNAGDVLPDAISLPRGLALKVLDAPGPRLPGSEGTAQDFVMVNGKTFQAKTAEKFLSSLKLLAKTTDRMEGTKKVVSAVLRGVHTALEAVGAQSTAVDGLGGAPNVEPLGETYYSVTPFRYGDFVAKFSLKPLSPSLTELTGKKVAIDGRENAIREHVQSEMNTIDGIWAFRVQLCRDGDKHPIEDPTVAWDEASSPWQRVATLRLRPQDSWAPAMVERVDEGMRFSVWTGLAAHQPLGDINRARRDTYRHSADVRAKFNGCPYHEPPGAAPSELDGERPG